MAQPKLAKRSRQALPRFLLALLPALTATGGPATSTGNSGSDLQNFKDFISHPPIISNLVFQQKVPMGGGARSLDGSFARSTSFEYFQARWQTNGVLFRRLSDLSNVTNLATAGELVSWSGHEHALVEPSGRFTTWDDRDPSVAGKTTSIFYTSEWLQEPLREVLNLGIMYAGIGSVCWEGNRFHAECRVDGQRLLISGEVIPSEVGPPMKMMVCYAFPHQTNYYAVRYGYAPERTCSMPPTAITNFWTTGGPDKQKGVAPEIDLDEWKIVNFEHADAPLAQEVFAVAAFASQNRWQSHIYTNAAIYDRSTNGSLHLAYSFSTLTSHSNAPSQRFRTVFYGGWGGMNIAIVALMARAKEAKKQQTKNERENAI